MRTETTFREKNFLDEMMSEEHDVLKDLLGVQEDGKALVWKNKDDADDVTWDCEQV